MKTFVLLATFLSALAIADPASYLFPAWDSSDEVRLPIADRVQARRTTSVNWLDLVPSSDEKKEVVMVLPQKPLLIILDAGHGGKDLGARGHYGIIEKKLCLKIAWMVKSRLEAAFREKGILAKVILSREKDEYLSLRDRVKIANNLGADLFVSVHANSSEIEKPKGFEVYFLSAEASDAEAKRLAKIENAEPSEKPLKSKVMSILSDLQTTHHVSESSEFAEVVYQSMARSLKPNGRGVRQAPFTVLAGTSMPALLVEVGYLSHPIEAQLLKSMTYLKRLANAISRGIFDFAIRSKRVG